MDQAVFLDLSDVVSGKSNLDVQTQNKILSLVYHNLFLPYRNNPEGDINTDLYVTVFGNRNVLRECMNLVNTYVKMFKNRYQKNVTVKRLIKEDLSKEYDTVYIPKKIQDYVTKNIGELKAEHIKAYRKSFHECDKNCQKCKCYKLMKDVENIRPTKLGYYIDFLKPYLRDNNLSKMIIINDYSSTNDLSFHKILSSVESITALREVLDTAIKEYAAGSSMDIEKIRTVIYSYFANATVVNAISCTSSDVSQTVGNNFTYLDSFANSCSSFVKEELKFINPEFVLALGSKAFAGLGLNKQDIKYSTARGKIVDLSEYGLPGKLFTTTSIIDLVKNFSLKNIANIELKTFIEHLIDKKYLKQQELFKEKSKDFVYVNTEELLSDLHKNLGKFVSIDIETNSLFPYKRKIDTEDPKITLFSITTGDDTNNTKTYLIPYEFDNTTELFRTRVEKLIKYILGNKNISKIFHNASFDLTFIKNKIKNIELNGDIHDTMLYTSLLSSESVTGFKSLDYLSAIGELGDYYEPLHQYRDKLIEIHRNLLKIKPEVLNNFYIDLFENIKTNTNFEFSSIFINKKIIGLINKMEEKGDRVQIGNISVFPSVALTYFLTKQFNLNKENYKSELGILKEIFGINLKFPTDKQLEKLEAIYSETLPEEYINNNKFELFKDVYKGLNLELNNSVGYNSKIVDLYLIALNKLNNNSLVENNINNDEEVKSYLPQLIDYSDIDVKELIPYAGGDSLSTYYIFNKLMKELEKHPEEELHLWIMRETMKSVVNMQSTGAKIDLEKREELIKEYSGKINTLITDIKNLATKEIQAIEEKEDKEFNINSLPNLIDLFKLLGIGKAGLEATLRKTEKNQIAMNKETIEKIAAVDDQGIDSLTRAKKIAEKLLEYRELNKLYSTYLDSYDKFISDDGYIHAKFRIDGTATGRAASSDPNLQNIPKPMKVQYISRYPCGKIINLDYSQLELRVLGWFIKGGALVDAFKNDEDIHLSTAKLVSGKEYLCKDINTLNDSEKQKYIDLYRKIEKDNESSNEEIIKKIEKITEFERKKAKTVNFGLIYGQTPWGLAYSLGITKEEAQDFINKYFENIPEVQEYLDTTKEAARKYGEVSTLFNSKRTVPTAFYDEVLESYKFDKDNKRAFFRLKASTERKAINAPVQGSAAFITYLSLIALNDYLKNKKAHMIMTVHDSIVLDVAPEVDSQKLVKELVNIMEHPIDYIVQNMEVEKNIKDKLLKISENYKKIVPLKAEAEIGKNYKELEPVQVERKYNFICSPATI